MTSQKAIRRRLVTLQTQQDARITALAQSKKDMDAVVAAKQRELDNLAAQVTIASV